MMIGACSSPLAFACTPGLTNLLRLMQLVARDEPDAWQSTRARQAAEPREQSKCAAGVSLWRCGTGLPLPRKLLFPCCGESRSRVCFRVLCVTILLLRRCTLRARLLGLSERTSTAVGARPSQCSQMELGES